MSRWKARGVALIALMAFAVAFALPVGATNDYTICHVPANGNAQTLNLSFAGAWSHILVHDNDYWGECEVEEEPTQEPTEEPTAEPAEEPTVEPTPDETPVIAEVPVVAPGVAFDPNCSLEEWVAGTSDPECAPWQRLRFVVEASDALYENVTIISGVTADGQVIDWFALPSSGIGYTAYSPAFQFAQGWTARLYVIDVDRMGEINIEVVSEYFGSAVEWDLFGEDGDTDNPALGHPDEDFDDVEIGAGIEEVEKAA